MNGEYDVTVIIALPPTSDFIESQIAGDGIHLDVSDSAGFFVKVNETFSMGKCPVGYGFDNKTCRNCIDGTFF